MKDKITYVRSLLKVILEIHVKVRSMNLLLEA